MIDFRTGPSVPALLQRKGRGAAQHQRLPAVLHDHTVIEAVRVAAGGLGVFRCAGLFVVGRGPPSKRSGVYEAIGFRLWAVEARTDPKRTLPREGLADG